MIILSEKTIAIWFIPLIPGEQDFIGSLFTNEEGKLEFSYRFRYYNSQDPYDKKDKKHWYTVVSRKEETKESMLASLRRMIKALELASGQRADEILMKDGNYKQFCEEFASKSWTHIEKEKIADA